MCSFAACMLTVIHVYVKPLVVNFLGRYFYDTLNFNKSEPNDNIKQTMKIGFLGRRSSFALLPLYSG